MRVLFLVHPGTNSRAIFLDLIQGFARAGHGVVTAELGPVWQAIQADPRATRAITLEVTRHLRQVVRDGGFDAVAGMWDNGVGVLGPLSDGSREMSALESLGVPSFLYWLDAPHWHSGGSLLSVLPHPLFADPFALHVINNTAMAREMREVMGFGAVHGVPYGVNPDIFRPHRATPEFDVVINAGPGDAPPTPTLLAALDSQDPPMEQLRRSVAIEVAVPRLVSLLAPLGESVAAAAIALARTQVDDAHTPMLDRAERIAGTDAGLTEGVRVLRGTPSVWARVTGEIRQISAWERAFTASWLSRRFNCAMVGDFTASWPFNGMRIGEVPYEGLSKAYSRGRVGLAVMRWQDDIGVHIKPMEMTASGVPAVCGRRVGLSDLFEIGREVLDFDSPASARQAITTLLDSGAARNDMADAGRARTLRDHTWRCRAGQFVDLIQRHRANIASHLSEKAVPPMPDAVVV